MAVEHLKVGDKVVLEKPFMMDGHGSWNVKGTKGTVVRADGNQFWTPMGERGNLVSVKFENHGRNVVLDEDRLTKIES